MATYNQEIKNMKLISHHDLNGFGNGGEGVANSVNDVYVDENRIIYAIDRLKGGLYILELTI